MRLAAQAVRSEYRSVILGPCAEAGADPSGPARKLAKSLARGRTCRDGVFIGGGSFERGTSVARNSIISKKTKNVKVG